MESIACQSPQNLYSEYRSNCDFVAAEEFYKKACNFGYYPACGNLGLIEIKSPDLRHSYALAKDVFDKGCKGQDGKSALILV